MRTTVLLLLALLAVAAPAAHAAEPDNSYDTATPMTGATDYDGDLSSMGDEDWFAFTAGMTGKAQVTLTMTANTCSSTSMFVRIMDSSFSQREVLYGGTGTPTTVDLDVVTNGRYYLQAGGGCTGTTYRVRLDPAGAAKTAAPAAEETPAAAPEAEQQPVEPTKPSTAAKKRLKKPPLGLYNCLRRSQAYTGNVSIPLRWQLQAGGRLRDITLGEAQAKGGRWTAKNRVVRVYAETGSLLGKFSVWRDTSGPYLLETKGGDPLVCRGPRT